jgi:hypothetical protein
LRLDGFGQLGIFPYIFADVGRQRLFPVFSPKKILGQEKPALLTPKPIKRSSVQRTMNNNYP